MKKAALTMGLILCSVWTSALAQIPKGRIIFSSSSDTSGKSELFIINSDGSNEHQLTHSGKRIDFSDFFQDRIAYMQVETDNNYKGYGSISRCDIPYWTSDNKYIVCSCRPEKSENDQIALVNVETGEKTFVTNDQKRNYFPAWVSGK